MNATETSSVREHRAATRERTLLDRIDLVERDLARLIDQVIATETKVNTIFAIDAGMLGILVANAPAHASWSPFGLACSLLSGLCLGASLLMLSLAAFPRTDGPSTSHIYFGSVSRIPFDDYLQRMTRRSEEDHLADLLGQYHRISAIATVKYEWIRRSMLGLYLGLPLWLASVYSLCQDRP